MSTLRHTVKMNNHKRKFHHFPKNNPFTPLTLVTPVIISDILPLILRDVPLDERQAGADLLLVLHVLGPEEREESQLLRVYPLPEEHPGCSHVDYHAHWV